MSPLPPSGPDFRGEDEDISGFLSFFEGILFPSFLVRDDPSSTDLLLYTSGRYWD